MSTRSKSKRATSTPSPAPALALASPPAPASSTIQNGRLFTDSNEIRLLKIFYKYTKSTQSTPSSSPSSSTPITLNSQTIQRINKALNSNFTPSQISDKLRRLRVKYHKQARSKSLIRTPHDHQIFDLARKIWGKKTNPKAKKVQHSVSNEDNEVVVAANGQERQGVDLEEYPALVTEFSKYLPMNSVLKEGLKMLGTEKLREMNDKWMSIGIEEAKIVAKKAELVKEQTQLLMQVLENGNGN